MTRTLVNIAYWLIVTIGGGGLCWLLWRESQVWWAELRIRLYHRRNHR